MTFEWCKLDVRKKIIAQLSAQHIESENSLKISKNCFLK